ncbi:hypothetical protein GCM10027613_26930 [Microlunatus endophyticus]
MLSLPKNDFSRPCTFVDSALAGRYDAWSLFVTLEIVPKVGPPNDATTTQATKTNAAATTGRARRERR